MNPHRLFVAVGILLTSCVGGVNLPTTSVPLTPHSKQVAITPYTRVDDCVTDPFPSIGSFVGHEGNLIGSGVVIRPNVVLTAGHVIAPHWSARYFKDSNQVLHEIKCVELHPLFAPFEKLGKDFILMDIAIVVLETNTDVVPMKLGTDTFLYRGKPLTTVGFGAGFKRFSNPNTFVYYGRTIEQPNMFSWLSVRWSIWFGDSGGAVLADDNGELKLVGIIISMGSESGRIVDNHASSIMYFQAWIDTVLRELE